MSSNSVSLKFFFWGDCVCVRDVEWRHRAQKPLSQMYKLILVMDTKCLGFDMLYHICIYVFLFLVFFPNIWNSAMSNEHCMHYMDLMHGGWQIKLRTPTSMNYIYFSVPCNRFRDDCEESQETKAKVKWYGLEQQSNRYLYKCIRNIRCALCTY